MDYFQRHEVKKIDPKTDEYTLFLYLNDHLTEFANELGRVPATSERKTIFNNAYQLLHQKYPNLKVTMVKVILGGMVVTSISLESKITSAQASEHSSSEIEQSGTVYYQIGYGDTLWNISKRFNISVDQIKRANNLTSDVVKLNQRIVIPKAFHTIATGDYITVLAKRYGTTVQGIIEANGLNSDTVRLGQTVIIPLLINQKDMSTTETDKDSASKVGNKSYTVVSGDSLSVIAKRYNVSIDDLRITNDLNSNFLRTGQVLTIPSIGKASVTEPSPINSEKASTYTVVSGDSIYGIAKRFAVTTDALKDANQLSSDILRIGQVLTIPSVVTPSPSIPTSHTVVAGETLWRIATNYGTTVDTLRKTNNLKSDSLQIGQKLSIIANNSGNKEQAPNPPITEKRTTFIYSVRSGDNLSIIASRFGVTIENIRKENNLKTDLLKVGQELTIVNGLDEPTKGVNSLSYKTHTVASGDNIWNLSVKYGIPQTELLNANNLKMSSMLSIGQKLKIPVHTIAVKQVVGEKYGEMLDWWTEAQYVFTIGKTAKVTDFMTGKSFYIKRTIGANHADSETVTGNDSKIAKSIWGGYSWTPRAVILEFDGRRIAASMSFMPHEQEYIKNNGITGHFDVYFDNCIRHKDGKPDASHQAQVEKAAGLR